MKVLTVEQIKNVEKTAVLNGLFSYEDLMKNAGKAVFEQISAQGSVAGKRVLILVGSGNNGGDGLVVAGLLKDAGAIVKILAPYGLPKTKTAIVFCPGILDIDQVNSVDDEFDIYVDALFGIGLNRELDTDTSRIIDTVNKKKGLKIAVDVPSGLFSNGGSAGCVFHADFTVTFIGYKLCQLLPPTSSFCGAVVPNGLGIDVKNEYSYSVIDKPIPKIYDKNAHKGTFGTVLTVCGSYGMCGASILSARAALTSGAGIVKSIVCDRNYSAFTSAVPEAVTIPVGTSPQGAPVVYDETMISAVSRANSLLVGCGLGDNSDAQKVVENVLKYTNVPTVIDADGINAVARNIRLLIDAKVPIILTPHPGEMARLLKTTISDVEANRVNYSRNFAVQYKCILVLKGANTIVASPDGEVFFNVTGNYGLAKGGSGDVLSGIIAALLANGYDPIEAALCGVYVHGEAGDNAAKRYSKRTVLPSDVIGELKHISF